MCSCRPVPLITCQLAQVCLRPWNLTFSIPARLNARLQVEPTLSMRLYIGIENHPNKRVILHADLQPGFGSHEQVSLSDSFAHNTFERSFKVREQDGLLQCTGHVQSLR